MFRKSVALIGLATANILSMCASGPKEPGKRVIGTFQTWRDDHPHRNWQDDVRDATCTVLEQTTDSLNALPGTPEQKADHGFQILRLQRSADAMLFVARNSQRPSDSLDQHAGQTFKTLDGLIKKQMITTTLNSDLPANCAVVSRTTDFQANLAHVKQEIGETTPGAWMTLRLKN